MQLSASVRPPVCLFRRSTAAAACGGFAAERPARRTHRPTAAGADAQQQRRRSSAFSSNTHCPVDSRVDQAEHRLLAISLSYCESVAARLQKRSKTLKP